MNRNVVSLFRSTFSVSRVSSQWVRVLSPMLRPTFKRCRREEERGKRLREYEGRGVRGPVAQHAIGVISREAIIVSLQQNRKHSETGLFTTTGAHSAAQSTLAPFSHHHILWIRPPSASRLLCPHRRCRKKPSVPPISTEHRPLWSWERQRKSISFVLGDCGWATHETHRAAKSFENKATSEAQFDWSHKLIWFSVKRSVCTTAWMTKHWSHWL